VINVRYWHKADIPTALAFVYFWTKADIAPSRRKRFVICVTTYFVVFSLYGAVFLMTFNQSAR